VTWRRHLATRLDASNSYLRYKAEAEEALRSCGIPAVIFRCDHIYGPPSEPGPTASRSVAGGMVGLCLDVDDLVESENLEDHAYPGCRGSDDQLSTKPFDVLVDSH